MPRGKLLQMLSLFSITDGITSSIVCNHSFATIEISSIYKLCYCLSSMKLQIIPIQLAREKKLMTVSSVMLKDPGGRSWPVKLNRTGDGRVNMTHGWVDFWKANQIAVGDTLIFEFMMPTVLQVHIFRGEGRAISIRTAVFSTDIVKKFEAH